MAYVLCLRTIYLLALAIIFYASGKIIGKEIITRNKIMQRVKGQYEEDDEDITFAEAIEELPEEERDDYRKNFIIECALLVFFVIGSQSGYQAGSHGCFLPFPQWRL